MAFSRKIQNGPRLMTRQQRRQQGTVPDIAVYENMVWVLFDSVQIAQIAGIGQFVQIDHGFVTLDQPVEDKITADKAGATGHENRHKYLFCTNMETA